LLEFDYTEGGTAMTAQAQSGSGAGSQPSGGASPQSGQTWDAGYKALFEGWRQAQDFWNTAARSWGEVAGAWMGQFGQAGQAGPGQPSSAESSAALRELQESAFAVGQAWMRLPLSLASGRPPVELQEAVTRLTQAQGRAYQLWLEALTRTGAYARGAAAEATKPGATQTKP
jgi:hypothetical protein